LVVRFPQWFRPGHLMADYAESRGQDKPRTVLASRFSEKPTPLLTTGSKIQLGMEGKYWKN
jgi:hypothetical protein